jgi:microcystin-dependent protein
MLVTNQTTNDFWFGPLHLPAGVGEQITVDDTSDTSLYLTDDVVADAVNNLYIAGKITVTSAADPFPRPTGTPNLIHGDGVPEYIVYAPQGTIYMRRDGTLTNGGFIYFKSTGITYNTGWIDLAVASGAEAAIPTGTVSQFAGATAPTGWLICDGSAVSRTTYSTLFGVVGATYGAGDGSTTFNVPDFRGRVPVGQFPSGKTQVATLGNNEGLTGTNASKRNVAHIHYPGSSPSGGGGSAWVPWLTGANQYNGQTMSGDADNISNPAYLVVNHIIKT